MIERLADGGLELWQPVKHITYRFTNRQAEPLAPECNHWILRRFNQGPRDGEDLR